MPEVYRSSNFSLTQAAVDHVSFLRGQYLIQFPDDPPVLAGFFWGHRLTEEGVGTKQLGVGFWRKSEVSLQAWVDEDIVEIAGFKVLLALPQVDLLLFRGGVIDFDPEEGMLVRMPSPQ